MRKLEEVVLRLLDVVPEDEELHADLRSKHSSVMYASPEMEGFWWREVADTLQDRMGMPPWDAEWKRQVENIWTGKA